MDRRLFIDLLGKGTLAVTLLPYVVESCSPNSKIKLIKGIKPKSDDELILANGLKSEILISWGDAISSNDTFGFNNDFLCFIPFENTSIEGLLWCNHEYVDPKFIHQNMYDRLNIEGIKKEMYQVGGSILHIKKMMLNGNWLKTQPIIED